MFISWETLPNSASQNTFLSKTHTVGQAVLDKSKARQEHALWSFINTTRLNPICSHSGDSQEQILFQTDFNKTDFF